MEFVDERASEVVRAYASRHVSYADAHQLIGQLGRWLDWLWGELGGPNCPISWRPERVKEICERIFRRVHHRMRSLYERSEEEWEPFRHVADSRREAVERAVAEGRALSESAETRLPSDEEQLAVLSRLLGIKSQS